MLSAGTPFVFLDDVREGRHCLYHRPFRTLEAHTPGEVDGVLAAVREGVAQGYHAAGYLAYEAGRAFEPRFAGADRESAGPIAWFGLFNAAEPVASGDVAGLLGDPAGAWIGPVRPGVAREDYDAMLAHVAELIAAGDIYQANLSFRARMRLLGSPPAAYARLRGQAGAGWGALVHDGARWLLSFSPELFFRTDGTRVEARPMKGTGRRGADRDEDDANAERLAADPKERAENLMIVDLLRNDLSRVAVPGSVRVPRLFAVERYPTVQQMVSAVEAQLAPGHDAVDVLRALFPCGSVTGAPKLRATEVIREIEPDARGVYTGAIGAIGPEGAAFNVAIRTLVIEEGADEALLGLGSAVVADSTAEGEWRECLAKAAFARQAPRPCDLLETMRFDPDEGLVELERHIARLGESAHALGFRFDRHAVRNELHTATFRLDASARVRLRLSPGGAVAIEIGSSPVPPAGPLAVRIVPLPVDPRDWRLVHKTSDRGFYDAARRVAGTDEVLFARPDGTLTEGSFTTLFARVGGRLVTPPGPGLLPGILRETLLERGDAEEGELRAEDLRDGFVLGNMLRGLMAARLI